MMIIVNRLNDTISGSVNGESYGVKFTQAKYDEMKRLEEEANNAVSITALQSILEQFKPLMTDGYKELVETACPYILVNEETGKFFLRTGPNDGDVIISSKPLPQAFVDRILISVEKGIDFLPIVKAWTRFLRNPYYSELKAKRFANYVNKTYLDRDLMAKLIKENGVSTEVATERATSYQTPITREGLICTYKVSNEVLEKFNAETGKPGPRYKKVYNEDDGSVESAGTPEYVEDRLFRPAVMENRGDAFYSYDVNAKDKGKAGHFIRVGHIHELDNWVQVDTNDDHSCVKGLHTGNQDYIRGYEGAGTETHNVFVDPMDIGAITDDGSGALRVIRYLVHSSRVGTNRGIYHSSAYAAKTDEAWAEFRKEAIAEAEKVDAENADLKKQFSAL